MILGSNSRIILNTSSLGGTSIINNSLLCPRGCRGYNTTRDSSILCGSCGLVLKHEEFEPEYYGGTGFDFQSNKK